MAKEKVAPEKTSNEGSMPTALKKEMIVYDGVNCQIRTAYPAGTPLTKIKDEHKCLIKETDKE